jgi:hypothetical protein
MRYPERVSQPHALPYSPVLFICRVEAQDIAVEELEVRWTRRNG